MASEIHKQVLYRPGQIGEQDWIQESDLADYVRRKEVRQMYISMAANGKWNLYVLLAYRQTFMVVKTVKMQIRGYVSLDSVLRSLKRFGGIPPILLAG